MKPLSRNWPKAALGLVAALALAFCALEQPVRSQTTGITVSTPVVSSKAATGTSAVLALDGKYSNCTITASVSDSSATITAMGNSLQGQYGPGGAPLINSNFGTAGVISLTPPLSATSGNVSNLPIGAYFTWTGNTGTLTAWETCTSGSSSQISGTSTITAVVSPIPLPVVPTGQPTWPVDGNGIPEVTTPPPYSPPTASASPGFPGVQQYSIDPCQDQAIAKTTAIQLFSTAATQELVTLSAGKKIHVCSVRITVASAETVTLAQFAGAACTSTTTTIATYYLQSGLVVAAGGESFPGTPTSSDDLCATTSGAVTASVGVTYVQQ